MTSKEIRSKFLDFFSGKDHKIVPSAPIVIKDDPTLMFTNAGMNQFKPYFLGLQDPKNPRVADTQKCLRVSGKHNDLEEVGKDTYHHTMFEMLGNWSFGDYFKKEAINWAWELLTKEFGIAKENLYATVFEGSNDKDKLDRDEEALRFWKEILPESRILFGDKKDNFWEMGEQGPCGPCSEIHVDLRPEKEKKEVPGASLVNTDHPLVIELWNLVFIQYNRKADGKLENLPQNHIDTGMGFERLCMVLQDKESSYDTDLFSPIISKLEELSGFQYGKKPETDVAIRVIADHIRAVCFAIADGQLPSNTGAGYVIRRILRRAIRYGFTFLKREEPFMHALVSPLSETMGEAFPEIAEQQKLIESVIKEEEVSFLKTLEQGLARLEVIIKKTDGKQVDGRKAFELYDTFGFPIDLTALILDEKGIQLDEEGFHKAMGEQKQRSKASAEVNKGDWIQLIDHTEGEFLGYDQLEAESKITKYRKLSFGDKEEQYQLVLDHTPFYPEGGGQVGDKGYLEGSNGEKILIEDTKKENDEIVHFAPKLPSDPNAKFKAVVDGDKRRLTMRNHTATHLLHEALRKILGDHVEQKGSAVHPEYLRFDFSHFSKMTQEEIREVEDFVNAKIADQIALEEQRNIPMKKALAEGAIALFGEKYGDTVRTVRFGDSIELCGGTHVRNTADIWHFKIVSESAIAAGIRRIEAITSDAVKAYFKNNEDKLKEIKNLFKGAQDPVDAVQSLQKENAEIKKQIEKLQLAQARDLKSDLIKALSLKGGVNFLAEKVSIPPSALKDLSFEMGNEVDNLVLILAADDGKKAMLSCYISKNVVSEKQLHAGNLVKEIAPCIQGGGGGQPFYATAGGSDISGIPEALDKASEIVSGVLN